MDEILIDEKRYVSSKRAAKMTGYAKDYVGQLCREGRVPARLVGRSWYVLETAIQDHRFGTAEVENNETVQATAPAPVFSQKWESPRYEASSEEFLPSLKQAQEEIEAPVESNVEEFNKASEPLQDSWRAWFDHVAGTDTEEVAPPIAMNTENTETEEIVEEEKLVEETESMDVNVPIHSIYQQPPQELLPHNAREEQWEEQRLPIRDENKRTENSAVIRVIQVGGILVAGVIAFLAFIGSGYLDEYIISNSQVGIMAGVKLYNK